MKKMTKPWQLHCSSKRRLITLTFAKQNYEFFVPWISDDGNHVNCIPNEIHVKWFFFCKKIRIFGSMNFGSWRPCQMHWYSRRLKMKFIFARQRKATNVSFDGFWLMETMRIALILKSTLNEIDICKSKN